MACARVFTFAAGLSEHDSDAAQSSMPEDVYNAPYKRKRAILSGLSLIDGRLDDAGAAEPPAPAAVSSPLAVRAQGHPDAGAGGRGALPESFAAHLTLIYEPSPNLDLALAVHDRGLVDYLSTAWERWAAMPADERCKFFQHHRSRSDGGGGSVPALVPGNGCARQDAITRPGNSLHSQTCYYHTDMDTPVFRELLPTLKADMAVLQAVVNAVSLDNNVSYHQKRKQHGRDEEEGGGEGGVVGDGGEKATNAYHHYYYALVSHPGHHAGPSSVGGYCYLNNAAILASTLLRRRRPRRDDDDGDGNGKNKGDKKAAAGGSGAEDGRNKDNNGVVVRGKPLRKVAILDVDYHAGNGTAAAFWSDPDVFVASIHADPSFDYPWNSCFGDDVGGGAGLGATLCLPLPARAGWVEYEAALRTALAAVASHGAQLLVVSLGLDAHADDPVQEKATAGMALTTEDYRSMGRVIAGAGLPTVFVQEGGYRVEVAGEIVANLFRGMEEGIDVEGGAH